MNTHQILSFWFFWGTIGCSLFFILVVVLFRTGLVYTARKKDGTLKDKIPLTGKLALLILPISFWVFQLVTNYFVLKRQNYVLNFANLFLINYGIYLILFLFDTIFIDGVVISSWRPAFLALPDEMGKTSMQKHILISFPIGLVIGVFVTLVSTGISYFIWFV